MDKLFSGGLAVGAGDADDGDGQVAAVFAGQFLEGGQHVGHSNDSFVIFPLSTFRFPLFINDAEGGPLLQRLRCKSIAVESFALEGKEEATGGDVARVGGDGTRAQISLVELFYHVVVSFSIRSSRKLTGRKPSLQLMRAL